MVIFGNINVINEIIQILYTFICFLDFCLLNVKMLKKNKTQEAKEHYIEVYRSLSLKYLPNGINQ